MDFVAFTLAFVICFGFVLSMGGRPERAAMSAQCLAFLSSIAAISFNASRFFELPVELVITDALLLVALTLIALKANRLWPIVLAGMQAATIFAHIAKAWILPLPPAGYAVFVQFWAWPMLAVTGWGAWNHRRRVEVSGPERDWKSFWPRP